MNTPRSVRVHRAPATRQPGLRRRFAALLAGLHAALRALRATTTQR